MPLIFGMDSGMAAWKTYTPDGRVLEVEHEGGRWIALCDGARGVASSAREAIAAALERTEASIGTREPALEAWVAAHAEQLEAEVG
jgi:hypothetical protein